MNYAALTAGQIFKFIHLVCTNIETNQLKQSQRKISLMKTDLKFRSVNLTAVFTLEVRNSS